MRRGVRLGAGLVARAYFDVSYALLTGSAAGCRLLALPAVGGGPVHGYFTNEDRDVLLTALRPAPEDLLLDLGSGAGGIAIDLHRRSGAAVRGVDTSPRAVSAATAGALRAGAEASVRFSVGDLARPPRVGARCAYAVDSLMFVPDLEPALRGIGDVLGSGGRHFATLLVFGAGAESRLLQAIRAAGADLERLDDVTPALAERSRARAGAAIAQRRGRTTSLRGRLAILLVIAEERLLLRLIAGGRVGRWRIVVRYAEGAGM